VKMLEFLDKSSQSLASSPEEQQDEISCWSRLVASRLRQLHPAVATSTMMQCDQVIFGAMQSVGSFQRVDSYDNDGRVYDFHTQS